MDPYFLIHQSLVRSHDNDQLYSNIWLFTISMKIFYIYMVNMPIYIYIYIKSI